MRRFNLAPFAASCLALCAVSANALDFNRSGNGGSISLNGTTIANLIPPAPDPATGGPFTITPTGSGWPAYVPGSFVSFCVELLETAGANTGYQLKSSTNSSDYLPGSVPPNAPVSTGQLAIIGQMITKAQNVWGASAFDSTNGTALQAAVWEVVYEKIGNPSTFTYADFNLAGGAFRANSGNAGAMSTISGWFDSNNANYLGNLGSYQQYAVLFHESRQDFLAPVPEPEAYGLALAGMGVVAFAMRRRRSAEKRD